MPPSISSSTLPAVKEIDAFVPEVALRGRGAWLQAHRPERGGSPLRPASSSAIDPGAPIAGSMA